MVSSITVIYLVYIFVSLYLYFFLVCLYLRNKNQLFTCPKIKKEYTVSILIPAYNEEDSIKSTIEAALKSKYKKLIEIIAINDGSKDKTAEIIKKLAEKNSKIKLLDKKNSGKADSLNQALKIAKGELIVVLDADSYILEDAVEKMIGYFDDKKIGSVTGRILVHNRKNSMEKFQAAEYAIIAFTRKLLEFIEGIWVTPGALSMYRKSALIKVGGFSTKNITEDVEITWRLIKNKYDIKMCLVSGTYTVVPSTFKKWWKQRVRWGLGGLQTILSYKKEVLKKGSLGSFIIPLFAISMFLGLFGLIIFTYLFIKKSLQTWYYSQFSFLSNAPLITADQLYMSVTILNFFWVVVFLLGLSITIIGFNIADRKLDKNPIVVLFYLLFYLAVNPFVLAYSVYKYLKKDITW